MPDKVQLAVNGLKVAIQFLTRIPVRTEQPPSEMVLGMSVLFYPLVGLLLASLLMLTAMVLPLPSLLMAAVLLGLWVYLSGGLHLDGLADSADAWQGGRDRETTLRILKDTYCGSSAIIAIVGVMLVKFAALAALIEAGNAALLLVAPILGRTAALILLTTTPYVRSAGLGEALSNHLSKRASVTMTACVVVALLAGFQWTGLVAVTAAVIVLAGLRMTMMKRIGGCTGDTIGAAVELVETAALIGIVIAS